MYSMYVTHIDYTLRGIPCIGSLYYTAQHVYYYTYTGPHEHSTVNTTLCTYTHLLDTCIIDDTYTYTIQYM